MDIVEQKKRHAIACRTTKPILSYEVVTVIQFDQFRECGSAFKSLKSIFLRLKCNRLDRFS